MAVSDPHFYDRLTDLAGCLCGKITENQLPATCFCGVIAGDAISQDYCSPCASGKCGMAWVRLVGIAEQEMTALGANTPMSFSACSTPLIATVEVGILRCAPVMSDDASMPNEAEHLAAASLQMSDMNAALQAIRCCFSRKDVKVQAWQPIGPLGGCLGGAWLVEVFEDM